MFAYGHAPSGGVMLAISLVHATNDGFTVSSCGVAVGMVVPGERQASAQGLLGGVETLVAGITATAIGQIYQHFGRTVAYTTCSIAMVALVIMRRRVVGHRHGGCVTPPPRKAVAPVLDQPSWSAKNRNVRAWAMAAGTALNDARWSQLNPCSAS